MFRVTEVTDKNARKPNALEGWQETFLAHFRETANISHAARLARVDRQTVIRHRKRYKMFAAQMQEAESEALEHLEYEAYRRAHDGTAKPVFYQGQPCGTVQEYSDTLMIVLLKARAPEKYRENAKVEHSGPGGGAIPITEVIVRRPERAEDE